jgi:predicted nuclease of restriction endonuclease-like (RecB) superfamily
MRSPKKTGTLLSSIKDIITKAKLTAYRNTNSILLKAYWEIGRLIVEEEQQGKAKAAYGKGILKNLSKQLTLEFGRGYDERNLNNIRAFYLSFQIWNAVRTELSWTHYRILSRIENEILRKQYLAYAIEGSWDTRALQRNITTQYIGRIVAPAPLEKATIQSLVKDPYIFEFLGMQAHASITESHIEAGLISHLQQFLMELGKGFAFVARQEHIVTDTSDFFVDLVFYNYYLKCFVLIELKTGKLTHAAIGQMDMYVRMYDDMKRGPDDNPTIGIILCTEKDEAMVKYSVLSGNEQLFASKYRLYLPREEELVQLLEEDMVQYGVAY